MSMPDDADSSGVKPFLEHLEDLRWTVVRCAVALLVGVCIAYPFAPNVLRLLSRPLSSVTDAPDQFLRSLEVGGAFSVSLRLAGWTGLLLSSPFLVLFIGRFVFPGLFEHERRTVARMFGFAVVLFAGGLILGYAYALPVAVKMMFALHGWMGVRAEWTITNYLAFSVPLLIGFGLVFELPVVLVALGRMGFITAAQLRQRRRHAIVAALVIGMVMTPPDVVSQVLMATPLIGLYEVSIWLVALGERRAKSVPA
ncbi:MAG TPA: twin-arginine translocase subunit TatC [Kiritimatiellia bacterium]|nr:twin-arginine translocase subunit TatC [Kiritimatiellia bacterium]HRZ11990.1 twin-arginine translocase subunit TatC [Kiritimatiellia bacterium]HSA17204.1 twin-arginine translocase subunit TatC [Kiritimatiellia bacterium]